MFTLDLPFPPSVNNLFVNRRAGGRHPSTKYKVWKTEAGWEIARQHPVPIVGPVKLVYVIQDKGRCDLGNLEKAGTDLLVSHKLIDGDSRKIVREINLSWSGDVVGARLTVTRFIPSSGDVGKNTSRPGSAPGHDVAENQGPGAGLFDCGASALRTSLGRVPLRDPGESQSEKPAAERTSRPSAEVGVDASQGASLPQPVQFHPPSSQDRSTGDVVHPQSLDPSLEGSSQKVDQTLRPPDPVGRSGLDSQEPA